MALGQELLLIVGGSKPWKWLPGLEVLTRVGCQDGDLNPGHEDFQSQGQDVEVCLAQHSIGH